METTYGFVGDQHCLLWKGKNRCAKVIDNGNGTYTRINNKGKPIIKWNKIVEGKDR